MKRQKEKERERDKQAHSSSKCKAALMAGDEFDAAAAVTKLEGIDICKQKLCQYESEWNRGPPAVRWCSLLFSSLASLFHHLFLNYFSYIYILIINSNSTCWCWCWCWCRIMIFPSGEISWPSTMRPIVKEGFACPL